MFEKVNPGHPDKMADRLAGAKNSDLLKRRAVKVHITANRLWVKDISLPQPSE